MVGHRAPELNARWYYFWRTTARIGSQYEKANVLRRLPDYDLRAKKIETSRKDFHSRIGIIVYYCLHSVVVANIISGDAFR